MFLAHINLATKLNNQGVSFLERRSFSEAMSAFQQSVAYMKLAADEFATHSSEEEDEGMIMNDDDHQSSTWSSEQEGPLHRTSYQHSAATNCGNNDVYFGKHFTYDRAFRLSEKFHVQSEEELSLLGAVVLTNYGISWQSKGGEEMDGNETCQKRAFQLYQLTLNMLEHSAIQEMAEASMLSLVVFNNMASLHHENCDYSQAQICLQTVNCLMQAIDFDFLLEDEMEQISMNVLLLVPPVAARAA